MTQTWQTTGVTGRRRGEEEVSDVCRAHGVDTGEEVTESGDEELAAMEDSSSRLVAWE